MDEQRIKRAEFNDRKSVTKLKRKRDNDRDFRHNLFDSQGSSYSREILFLFTVTRIIQYRSNEIDDHERTGFHAELKIKQSRKWKCFLGKQSCLSLSLYKKAKFVR